MHRSAGWRHIWLWVWLRVTGRVNSLLHIAKSVFTDSAADVSWLGVAGCLTVRMFGMTVAGAISDC